jgi:excinuclease ABC subunit C
MQHVVPPSDLAKLPASPGVYLFVDRRGRLLYVGRASNLRARVRSYWNAGLHRPGFRRMVRGVARILVEPCVSEHEAALLERMLLERLDPPFNRTTGIEAIAGVRVRVTPPGIGAVVDLEKGMERLFGPYLGWAPTFAAAAALSRLFPLHFCRPETDLDSVQRDIARIRGVSVNDFEALSAQAVDVLERDPTAVAGAVERVRRERDHASDMRLYERAAELQRQIDAIRWIAQPQRLMTLGSSGDRWVADEARIGVVAAAIA